MKLKLAKQKRIATLLEELKTNEMTRHQMAEFLGITQKAVCHYVTELKFHKQIYISRYETNSVGSYLVYYMTGNKSNAVRPKAKTAKEFNEQAKKRLALNKTFNHKNFVPHMDFAASWLRNPVC